MPSWNDLIDLSFQDLAVIQPGQTISGTQMQAPAQVMLNQLLSSLSTEQLTAYNQVMQTFALVAGQTNYTLGAGGTWSTVGGQRAQRVTAWRGFFATILSGGGPVLSMAAFDAAAQQMAGETSIIPKLLGADTAFPLINIRVFPPPSGTTGNVEVAYWTPVPQISDFSQSYNLPEGWALMLHWGLAVLLFPQYARVGQTIDVIVANAQNSKASIVAQNNMNGGLPPAVAA